LTTGASFGRPLVETKAVHQLIDQLTGVLVSLGGQVGVSGGGQQGVVAKDFLHLGQFDTGLEQMGGIAVA